MLISIHIHLQVRSIHIPFYYIYSKFIYCVLLQVKTVHCQAGLPTALD